MDVLIIPVRPKVPHFEQTTTLDGRPFRLRFDWIQRIERWTISIYTGGGEALTLCKGLVLNGDALRQIRYDPRAPQGVLTVVDLEAQDVEPTLTSLGVRHRVLYFSGAVPETSVRPDRVLVL